MNKMHRNWRENGRGLVIAYPIPGSMYDGGYMGVGLGMEIGKKKITHQRKTHYLPDQRHRETANQDMKRQSWPLFCCGKKKKTPGYFIKCV